MNYTVAWRPAAERALAQIWIDAVDRQAVTDAADLIDAMLGTSPHEVGESRAGDTRILTVMPLSIYYVTSMKMIAWWRSGRLGRLQDDNVGADCIGPAVPGFRLLAFSNIPRSARRLRREGSPGCSSTWVTKRQEVFVWSHFPEKPPTAAPPNGCKQPGPPSDLHAPEGFTIQATPF